MSDRDLIAKVEKMRDEAFEALDNQLSVNLGENLDAQDLEVVSYSNPRVKKERMPAKMSVQHLNEGIDLLVVHQEDLSNYDEEITQSGVGEEVAHWAHGYLGQHLHEALGLETPNILFNQGRIRLSDYMKAHTAGEFVGRIGAIATSAELDVELEDMSDLLEGTNVNAIMYDRPVDVRTDNYDKTLDELSSEQIQLFDQVCTAAGYRAAENNIVEALSDPEIMSVNHDVLWNDSKYEMDFYEQEALREVVELQSYEDSDFAP